MERWSALADLTQILREMLHRWDLVGCLGGVVGWFGCLVGLVDASRRAGGPGLEGMVHRLDRLAYL